MTLFLALACAGENREPTALVAGSSDRAVVPESVQAERVGATWRIGFATTGLVAGDFSDWQPTPSPVEAEPGLHRYKFVVDGHWIADPANPRTEPDGFGGQNSLFDVGLPDPTSARLGDRVVDGDALAVRWWPDGLLRVRTLRGDVTELTAHPSGQPLRKTSSSSLFDWWAATVATGPGQAWELGLADGGLPARLPQTAPDPLPRDDTPAWARDITWYQVFPDRFRNGDPRNDPPGTRAWNAPWDVPIPAIWSMHLGGDFAGIEAGLGHIASLGATGIYLNPVWAAPSPHRYDATTWFHVDPDLGAGEPLPEDRAFTESDRHLLRLVAEVHRRGMRVVLDGVFNHVGASARLPKAWFARDADGAPRGWNGNPDLLELDHADPHVLGLVLAATRRWMDPDGDGDPSDGIDGWRLDVADEVPADFWRRWRAEVRSINPEAVIVGEIWKHPERWIAGDTFDGITDYGFATAVLRYAEGGEAAALAGALADRDWPPPAEAVSWTLLDSHDTDRLASRMFNPGRAFDQHNRTQDDPSFRGGRPDETAWERARLAVFLQATLPGSPVIFQGDEVGVWGADDPHNRRPLPWPDAGPPAPGEPRWDGTVLASYRELFGLRQELDALRRGALETVTADGGLWVYRRGDVVCAVNSSNASMTLPPVPAGSTRRLGVSDAVLGPRAAALWVTPPVTDRRSAP